VSLGPSQGTRDGRAIAHTSFKSTGEFTLGQMIFTESATT